MSNHHSNKQDTIYRAPIVDIKPFVFDEQVADVFADMIQRSVPGYQQTLALIQTVTSECAQENTCLYDLGCSLGAATMAMRQVVEDRDCEIVAVDNSAAMVQRCRQVLMTDASSVPVTIREQDVLNVSIENASIVVMNYTLQFIPLEQRQELLSRIYQGLNEGGVFILSEKIIAEDKGENDRLITLHQRFKQLNGYNDLEIAQKRSALENVLLPEKRSVHIKRLESAGFESVIVCLQFMNFVTFIAARTG